ncbi:ribosome maturation factor RimM [Montanilutibacter psychrotolerans]|uniref:Ribosome maturation factor RimM n=1 Tax=Montanilutibacter psychrotolerans TaxID=1327343 RepID=A0A3M8T099_9GAMM|nr:ribosome maturation factor RimM [Lysobacter psychrotolerans]RNF85116.1 ribosome maturation factor RimM [Lysobacter psychrotolerans]
MNDTGRRILLGRVLGAFGLRGELKLESWTEPRPAIFRYQPWILRDPQGVEREVRGARGKESGKYLIGHLPDVLDRDAAEAMRGTEIYIPRAAMPPPKPGEYYWVDLEGLRVVNVDGTPMGVVTHLFSTGANDVLVTRDDSRERMIPFVQPQYVTSVDFEAGVVTVDWDPDF